MPMTQTEAHRLAAAVNQLRPEWPLASLSTFIHKNLATRAYRDAAVALTWVATDPVTLTPARVLEAGPWWHATSAGEGTPTAPARMCPHHPEVRLSRCDVDGPCAAEVSTDHAAAANRARIAAGLPPKEAGS